MEQRMSLRIPGGHSATIKFSLALAITGDLRNISFDGAFLVTKRTCPQSLLGKRAGLRVHNMCTPDVALLEIPAQVVRARPDGVAVAFGAYDEAVNAYLERLYSMRLSRSLETHRAVATSSNTPKTTRTLHPTTGCAVDF